MGFPLGEDPASKPCSSAYQCQRRMDPSGGRYPAILSLPYPVLRKLAGILDGAAVHNWKALVEHLPEYTQSDAVMFATEEQQGRSPTMAIMSELDSRGWSVVDLAQLAHKARLGIAVDIIKEHCRAQGWSLPLPPPSTLHSARECRQKPSSPPKPTPPTTPTARKEALDKYNSAFAPTPDNGSVKLEEAQSLPLAAVPYQTLLAATAGFSPLPLSQGGHKLGEGGSGEVFHSSLSISGGQERIEIAVKVLRRDTEGSEHAVESSQFLAEIRALAGLHHPHLLPVLGFSCDGPRHCILYPYLPRGSLLPHLPHTDTLTPTRRLTVACHVASALHYLHTSCEKVFVHRDVKSANILLANDWSASLGDYGVLRVQPLPGTTVTTTVAGTQEYMDPDYVRGGMVSEKTDVYSFGVVLFELLLGTAASGPVCWHGNIENTDIISFVEEYDGDPCSILIGQWPAGVGQAMWQLAEQCVEERSARPSSTEVLTLLQALKHS